MMYNGNYILVRLKVIFHFHSIFKFSYVCKSNQFFNFLLIKYFNSIYFCCLHRKLKENYQNEITDQEVGSTVLFHPANTEPKKKRIIFDKTYISDSDANLSKGKSDQWYKLLITPDLPWFQQGVNLQPSTQYVTGPELKKLEEEGSQHLESDVIKFKKGISC